MKKTFFFFILFLGCAKNVDPPEKTIRGVDISFLPEARKFGLITYNTSNQPEEMLITLKKSGVNTVRIRLWKNPEIGISDLATVQNLAKECKSLGFKILLCPHYSDTWADPGSQTLPVQWRGLSVSALTDSVSVYTQKIVAAINPEYIQLGNEINNGLLWPQGKDFSTMKTLLKTASKAVRKQNPSTKIIIHYAGYTDAINFFERLADLDYDIAGLSYYPQWHGKDLLALESTMKSINNKSVMITETSYPFTLDWYDYTHNVLGEKKQILDAYPPTPTGQRDFLLKLREMLSRTPRSVGFCYWGGEWLAYKGRTATDGSSYENQALWDFNNKALPVLEAFRK